MNNKCGLSIIEKRAQKTELPTISKANKYYSVTFGAFGGIIIVRAPEFWPTEITKISSLEAKTIHHSEVFIQLSPSPGNQCTYIMNLITRNWGEIQNYQLCLPRFIINFAAFIYSEFSVRRD